MADWLKIAEVLGIWFTGIATVSVVFIALFLETFRQPKLLGEFNIAREQNYRYLSPDIVPGRQELWIRLLVKNKNHYTTAKAVQVRVTKVKIKDGQNWRLVNPPAWNFKVSNLNAVSVSIPPRYPQYFDLGYVVNDVGTNDAPSFFLVTIKPDGIIEKWEKMKHIIEHSPDNKYEIGKYYYIYLAITSENTRSKFYSIEIKINAQLISNNNNIDENQFKQYMEVGNLQEVGPIHAL